MLILPRPNHFHSTRRSAANGSHAAHRDSQPDWVLAAALFGRRILFLERRPARFSPINGNIWKCDQRRRPGPSASQQGATGAPQESL